MQVIGDLFNTLLLQPLINLIVVILMTLEGLNLPGALGFAIIFLTVLVTLVTWPFRSVQIKSAKHTAETMQKLKPKMEALKQKYKGDKLAYNQAYAQLLKEHGVNPAAGCLPTLIPILLILPLYQVILAFFEGDKGLEKINYFLYLDNWRLERLPDLNFFGLNLGVKPSDFTAVGAFVLLVPVITAILTFIQTKMMSPEPVRHYKTDTPRESTEKEKTEDMTTMMQSQMVLMMPIMIGVFAFQFPIGLAIYWNTLTILGIIQQYMISGWGGLASFAREAIKKIKV